MLPPQLSTCLAEYLPFPASQPILQIKPLEFGRQHGILTEQRGSPRGSRWFFEDNQISDSLPHLWRFALGLVRGGGLMVWSMSYQPKLPTSPDAEVVEGNLQRLGGPTGQHIELEDYTPDGGGGLQPWYEGGSGRRVKPESLPKVIRWKSKRPLLDFEVAFVKTVSERFRDLIEEIEPGVHQFEPIQFISQDRSPLGTRWFWQVCNRLDTVDRDKSNCVLDGNADIKYWTRPASVPKERFTGLIFSLLQIGNAQFWYDKYEFASLLCSDNAKNTIEVAGMTGICFLQQETA